MMKTKVNTGQFDIDTLFRSCNAHLPSVNAMTLKLIAIITMTIDHVAAGCLSNSLYAQSLDWLITLMRLIGRLAFPLYIFMLTEGVIYTRSREKYFGRLLAGALLAEIPFDYALFGAVNLEHCSVMVTLALGFLIIAITRYLQERVQNNRTVPFAIGSVLTIGVACLCQFISSDYGAYGLMAIFGCYITKEFIPGKKGQLLSIAVIILFLSLLNSSETYALLDLILILMYDGTKGIKKKSKIELLMNLYYPIHLSVIALARMFWLI